MHIQMFKPFRLFAMLALAAAGLADAAPLKIAVTDLTYEEKVSEYFRVVSAQSKGSLDASGSERESTNSYSSKGRIKASRESSYFEAEGYYTYIDRGELRTYTADLKGALLKGGGVRLIQAKPYAGKPTDKIHDIIGRIKQGLYRGADYVLFGTVSNIEFRQESMQLPSASSLTGILALDLQADFSLINTKTYEVTAAFSASGSGQDTRIIARAGDRVVFNRGKVMSETSKSLAESAYEELTIQLSLPRMRGAAIRGDSREFSGRPGATEVRDGRRPEPVTVYN